MTTTPQPGQQVNRVGKYLYKNIDGAFKITFGPNECTIKMRMYYQIPNDSKSLDEMHFNINITTYQNKLRVNVIEDTEMEKTLGHFTITPEQTKNLEVARDIIYDKVCHYIEREYSDYDFVY